MTRAHGPRAASRSVIADDPRYREGRALASTGSSSQAHRDAAYYRTECGYTVRVVRTEFCPERGCDGWGNVKTRGRGGFYRDSPCKRHVAAEEIVEPISS